MTTAIAVVAEAVMVGATAGPAAERGEGALAKVPGGGWGAGVVVVRGSFEGAELAGTVAGVVAPDRLEGAYTWAAERWLQHIQRNVSFRVGSGSSVIERSPPRFAVVGLVDDMDYSLI